VCNRLCALFQYLLLRIDTTELHGCAGATSRRTRFWRFVHTRFHLHTHTRSENKREKEQS
jgi:hypothetical protein